MSEINMREFNFVDAFSNANGTFKCIVCWRDYANKKSIERHIKTKMHISESKRRCGKYKIDTIYNAIKKVDDTNHEILKIYQEKGYLHLKNIYADKMRKVRENNKREYQKLKNEWSELLDATLMPVGDFLDTQIIEKIFNDKKYIKEYYNNKIKNNLMEYVCGDVANIIMNYL